MALELDVKDIRFRTIEAAYAKIDPASITERLGLASFCVSFSNAEGVVFNAESFTFPADNSGGNLIPLAYEHLKTLPEFAGATDC